MHAIETPGALLRNAREQRGVSIKELAAVTRISPRLLVALEADDHDAFPAEIFVRGFLKNCARELRIDADTLLSAYARHTQKGAPVAKRHVAAEPAAAPEEAEGNLGGLFDGAARLPGFSYAIAILAIILGLGLSILIFGSTEPEQLSNTGTSTSPWTGAP